MPKVNSERTVAPITNRHQLSQHRPKLTPAQELAVDALAAGKRDAEAAELANVRRETVCRWRQRPEIQLALADRRAEFWANAVDRFRSLLQKALDTIERVLDEGDEPSAVAASLALLKLAGPLPLSMTNSVSPADSGKELRIVEILVQPAAQGNPTASTATNEVAVS